MAKPGPKPKSAAMKAASGETRPSQAVVTLFPDHVSRPDPDHLPAPTWLPAAAKKVWGSKVARYRQRGQKVQGFEDALAQYCALEAELIAIRRKRDIPPMAMVTAHRVWASEFYDTPSSQNVRPGSKPTKGNGFDGIGKRPG